jgi:hypothetical protein
MDKSFLVSITAFAGLAGALLSQLMTGLFAYVNDERKRKTELENQYRNKRLEIGENFYFVNGELMTMIRKNIDYWYNLRNDRNEQTLLSMKKEMDKLNSYQAQLHTDNWKYNLVGVYFEVPFEFDEIQQANRRSHQLCILVNDLGNKIREAGAGQQETLYKTYNIAIFDLCSHYEQVFLRMQGNMVAIKEQLLGEFSGRIIS